MCPDDPLSEKENVTAKDLSAVPLILPRRMSVQSELTSWFGNYYDKLNVVFTSNLSTNGAIMVNSSLAYSLVIEGSVPFWDQSKEKKGSKTELVKSRLKQRKSCTRGWFNIWMQSLTRLWVLRKSRSI